MREEGKEGELVHGIDPEVVAFIRGQNGSQSRSDFPTARISSLSDLPDILGLMADACDGRNKGQAYHASQYSKLISSIVGQGNPIGTVSESIHTALLNDMRHFQTYVDQVFVDQQRQLQNLHEQLIGSADRFKKRNYVFSNYKWKIRLADPAEVEFVINNRYLEAGGDWSFPTGNIKEDCLMYTSDRVREDYEIFWELYHLYPEDAVQAIPNESQAVVAFNAHATLVLNATMTDKFSTHFDEFHRRFFGSEFQVGMMAFGSSSKTRQAYEKCMKEYWRILEELYHRDRR